MDALEDEVKEEGGDGDRFLSVIPLDAISFIHLAPSALSLFFLAFLAPSLSFLDHLAPLVSFPGQINLLLPPS